MRSRSDAIHMVQSAGSLSNITIRKCSSASEVSVTSRLASLVSS